MSEKSLEMKHFQVFTYPEEPELALPGPLESLGMETMRETAPMEAVGCTIDGGQEDRTEIPVKQANVRFGFRHFASVCLLLALVVVLAGVANGQEYRARVQGLVTDLSQAAIVAAKVTLKNVNTGVETVKETDAAGRYLYEFVLPGTYAITLEATGFNRFVQENITVLTRGDVTVNAQLEVGALAETITVTEEVARLQTTTATMTTTVQGNMLRDIPVLARNPFTLALLNPAVIDQYWVAQRNPFYMWSSNGLVIGGRTGGKNDMLLDGAPLEVSARGGELDCEDRGEWVMIAGKAVRYMEGTVFVSSD